MVKRPSRKNLADISAAYRSTPVYVVIASTLTMAVIGALAVWWAEPFVFPPIGATLFILFAFPLAQEANPRNVLGGHLVGLVTGIVALVIFGLVEVPPDTTDLDWTRLGAILLGLAVAISVLMGLRLLHIPSVATTLVVAMGLLSRPQDWAFMLLGVLVATAMAVAINRLTGIPHPFWHDPKAERAMGRD